MKRFVRWLVENAPQLILWLFVLIVLAVLMTGCGGSAYQVEELLAVEPSLTRPSGRPNGFRIGGVNGSDATCRFITIQGMPCIACDPGIATFALTCDWSKRQVERP